MAETKLQEQTIVEVAKRIKELEEPGVQRLAKEIDGWSDITVNIAVTGMSGAGKSFFINATRNLQPLDPGAAKVGPKETTMEPTRYSHPQYPNLVFWDLPGVGTRTFPRAEYKESVGLEKYDFFLILSSTSFSEDDCWLAEEVAKVGKSFLFVRTKVDIDVNNARADTGASENDTLHNIREYCKSQLDKLGLNSTKVFLISSRYPKAFDFDSLFSHLIGSANDMQKEVLTLTLFSWSNRELLERKKDVLQGRIKNKALLAASYASLPFFGATMKNKVIEEEVNFYRKEFCLDYESIKSVADRMGFSVSELSLRTPPRPFTGSDIAKAIAAIPIPLVGALPLNVAKGVIGAATEYFPVRNFLQNTLDKAYLDACEIHNAYMRANASKL